MLLCGRCVVLQFDVLIMCPYDIRHRALPGVYVLTRARVLRYLIVALDIDASVNTLAIHDLFMNASDAPFPVIYHIPWDIRPRLFTLDSECILRISSRRFFSSLRSDELILLSGRGTR
jgi:hypothetical protein